MILSVSRRTDIPNYYSEWFFNRIKEGFAYVRNPMNVHQISEIALSPEVVDCIVFWTKNPEPMLGRLDELAGYDYYFQFTLTGYGTDIERGVLHKKERLLPVFRELSERLGKERVIWRYDPIIFTGTYTPEYHLRAFAQIASALRGYTERCVISFVDTYAKNRRAMTELGVYELEQKRLLDFARAVSEIASANGMEAASCAERMDLGECGIAHGCCIDKALIERITGCKLRAEKDKNQRPECGCVESIDIGAYNTCKNGCRYCYANESAERVAANCGKYHPASPLLCGTVSEEDRITQRKVKSLKERQISLLD